MSKTTKPQGRRIDLEQATRLSRKCAEGELSNPLWEKYDATDWHSEAAEELGLDYDAAGAHIAYWFAWLVEHDLESGFVCTDSDELIRGHVTALNRMKDGEPDAIDAMLGEAEELHGAMLSDAGNQFTKANYEQYLQDYSDLLGQQYADFSRANYTRVREMLEVKYGPRLPSPD
jgi:hypothetical protein